LDINKDFRQLEKQIDRMLNGKEKVIGKHYANLLKEIRHKLSDWDVKHGLGYGELNKYGRLEKLEKQVADIVRKGTTPVSREIRSGVREGLTTAYQKTTDAIGEATGRKIRGVLKPETMKAIEQSPHSGLKLNERLQARRAETELKIRETLKSGIYRGESYKDIAGKLKDELDITAGKSMRIARTETHRAMETGKYESLQHAQNQGVQQMKWWLNSGDERVRDSHEHMGQKYSKDNMIPLDEDFVNDLTGGRGPHPGALNTPEDDIHERCLMMVEIIAVGKKKV